MINFNPDDVASPSLFEIGKIESNPQPVQNARFFHWLYLLWKIDDERIINMANLDGFIYLMYQRNVAKFFGILTFLSLTVLLPMYATESDASNSKYSFLTHTSLMNIVHN